MVGLRQPAPTHEGFRAFLEHAHHAAARVHVIRHGIAPRVAGAVSVAGRHQHRVKRPQLLQREGLNLGVDVRDAAKLPGGHELRPHIVHRRLVRAAHQHVECGTLDLVHQGCRARVVPCEVGGRRHAGGAVGNTGGERRNGPGLGGQRHAAGLHHAAVVVVEVDTPRKEPVAKGGCLAVDPHVHAGRLPRLERSAVRRQRDPSLFAYRHPVQGFRGDVDQPVHEVRRRERSAHGPLRHQAVGGADHQVVLVEDIHHIDADGALLPRAVLLVDEDERLLARTGWQGVGRGVQARGDRHRRAGRQRARRRFRHRPRLRADRGPVNRPGAAVRESIDPLLRCERSAARPNRVEAGAGADAQVVLRDHHHAGHVGPRRRPVVARHRQFAGIGAHGQAARIETHPDVRDRAGREVRGAGRCGSQPEGTRLRQGAGEVQASTRNTLMRLRRDIDGVQQRGLDGGGTEQRVLREQQRAGARHMRRGHGGSVHVQVPPAAPGAHDQSPGRRQINGRQAIVREIGPCVPRVRGHDGDDVRRVEPGRIASAFVGVIQVHAIVSGRGAHNDSRGARGVDGILEGLLVGASPPRAVDHLRPVAGGVFEARDGVGVVSHAVGA